MKRILYIEDSVASQRIFQRMFQPAHEVTIVASPRAGQEALASSVFDLVVCDFMFPQGDAFDVLVPLRQRQPATVAPFICVSSSMDQALAALLLAAGANACAAKPFHHADFRAMLERMLVDPFVEASQGLVSACSFQWSESGQYHEFCPETGDRFSGTDRAEVSSRMQAALQERTNRGTLAGRITQERTRTYVLRAEAAAES